MIAQPALRFLYALARELGITAAEASRMSAREFAYWNQYLTLKPEELVTPDIQGDLMKILGGPRG